MNCKLIALDLDDTLLNDQCRISSRTKEAIGKVQARGIHVTLATGRMFRSALRFARELGINLPLITYQGALVKTSGTGEILHHRPIPAHLAREVVQIGMKENLSINVYLDDQLFTDHITPGIRAYCRSAQVPYTEVEDLLALLDRDPTKVLLLGGAEELDLLWVRVKKRFGADLYITKSKPQYLEFTHPQATKGDGLRVVARHLGVAQEEIMAFGDSYNDLELFRHAGFSVAMGNARDEVKREADYVTGSNNADGVAQAIEKLILEESS